MIPNNQIRPNFGEASNPSPRPYRRDGTRPKAPHQCHCLADAYLGFSYCLSDRFASGRLENGDQLCQPPIIRVAGRTITVGLDPFRMLRQQIAMQLFLQISIRSNPAPVRPELSRASQCRPCIHSDTLGFGAPTRYGALERFIGAPSVGL
jgi:hypothetical protein